MISYKNTKTGRHDRAGFVLPMVLVLLVVLTIFGIAMMLMSTTSLEQAGNTRSKQEAIDMAYSAYQRALTMLERHSCTPGGTELLDTDGDGYVDSDDTIGTPGVVVTCESQIVPASSGNPRLESKILITATLKSCANPSTENDHFKVRAYAAVGETRHTIEAEVAHDSFLNYSRFCNDTVSYGNGAVIGGNFYSGGNVNISGNVHFLEDVTVNGQVTGGTPTIDGELKENYPKVLSMDIQNQVEDFIDEAQTCGWVINNANDRACLRDSYDGSNNLLDFSDFVNLDPASSGTPAYVGDTCTHVLPNNFNGVVIWDDSNSDQIHVRGTLGADGAGRGVTVFSRSDIYIDNNILGGTDLNNRPVNIGLVADGSGAKIRISRLAPAFLTVEAAVMSARSNWRADGNGCSDISAANGQNPPTFGNVFDMDGDGNLESPNEWGYDENNLSPNNTVMLRIIGPIITDSGGSSGKYGGCVPCSGCKTRSYEYDVDIRAYPPPFPKIANLLHLLSYNETEEKL